MDRRLGSRTVVFPAGVGGVAERLRILRAVVLTDSLAPCGMGGGEREYAAHLEHLERLEVRPALAEAGLLG